MTNAGKILVTGATGNVGSLLIPDLIAMGADVRALVRDESKAQGLIDAGVEVIIGDLDKPDTLDAAFRGVDKVFLITPPNPNQVIQTGNGSRSRQAHGQPVHSQTVGGRSQRDAWRCTAYFRTARRDRWDAEGVRPSLQHH